MFNLTQVCVINSNDRNTKRLDVETITQRPRRNRKSPSIRSLVQETRLHPSDFVVPLFLIDGEKRKEPISSMPGIDRLSLDLILKEVIDLYQRGIRAVDLFPVIAGELKDPYGSEALREENLLFRALNLLKREIPEMCLMVDVALDPYTDHGHDGLVNAEGIILNDPTVEVLGKLAVMAAEAGADVVAPSDMMDGRVAFIRQCLDHAGYQDVNILSYAAKYASAFYGPFRDALQSAPKFGDKKTYQMDPANAREALRECALDEMEGADMLLIKPALAYLDIIAKVKERTHLPVGAYHVSGEYAMVMAAHQNGWLDAGKVFHESLTAIKRAGADFIFTYAVKHVIAAVSGR